MSREIYIHYGSDHFKPELVLEKSKNLHTSNKPNGLWGSPTSRKYWTWKDWCKSEDFRSGSFEKSFKFRISRNAKLLWVHELKDIKRFIKKEKHISSPDNFFEKLDIKKIMENYDGMVLIHGKNYDELRYSFFYSWDVDSICVWNPDVVELI